MIEEDACSNGDVERVGASFHGNGDPSVAGGEDVWGEALGFAAEEQGQTRGAGGGFEGLGIRGENRGGELHVPFAAQAVEVVEEVGRAEDGELEDGAHGDA